MSNRRSRGPRPWSRDACTGHRSARRNRPDAGDPLRTRDPCPPGRAGIRRLARHRAPHGERIRCHRRGPVACSGRSGVRGPGVTDRSWTPRVRHGRGKLLVDGGVPAGGRTPEETTAGAVAGRGRLRSRRGRSRSPERGTAVRRSGRPSQRASHAPAAGSPRGRVRGCVRGRDGRRAVRPGRLRDRASGRRPDRARSADPPTCVYRTRRTQTGIGASMSAVRPSTGSACPVRPAPDRTPAEEPAAYGRGTLRRLDRAIWSMRPTPPSSTIFDAESAKPVTMSALIFGGMDRAFGSVTMSTRAGPL